MVSFGFLRIVATLSTLIATGVLAVVLPAADLSPTPEEGVVVFNRDIRPILTQHCTSCHGGVKSAGDVSFVYPDQVLPPDGWVIEPGDAEASVLFERITTDDPDTRMPPPHEHPDPLSADEISTIRRWIDQGASWQEHWSMTPIQSPPTPDVSVSAESAAGSPWPRQSLDHFTLQGMRDRDLAPSPEAPPRQWLRRTAFVLTGLPPTMADCESFDAELAAATDDGSREAVYQSRVDQWLASEHFGERWASVWMDLARYADSMGFEKDPHRDMWPYRDWLVRAFNADMPYDEFTIKQLAGDRFADPTADDLIATAFHRNTQTNTEGGTDDEEFRVAALIDRVSTTWTVWQATTFGCVQCHAHPYDPYQHDEFYASLALFNDTLDADLEDDFPSITVPADRTRVEEAIAAQTAHQDARVARNDLGWQAAAASDWTPLAPKSATTDGGRLRVVDDIVRADGGTFHTGVEYTIELPAGPMTALRLEIWPENDDPTKWPEHGSLLTTLSVALHVPGDNSKPAKPAAVKIADVFADAITGQSDPTDALRGNQRGVGEYPKLHGPRQAVFVFDKPIVAPENSTLRLTMKHAASTSGGLSTPLRKFRWSSTNDADLATLRESAEFLAANASLTQSLAAVKAIDGVNLPIMRSRPGHATRATRMFIRGNWLDLGDEVPPGIPAVLAEHVDPDQRIIQDRLDLARWLVSDENPLAARVWANRIWAQAFGRGLVETLEDFGSSGLTPTHPELLDHLATRLRDDHDWHLKPFLRELVLSSTFRQTNIATAEQLERDFQNQWLARGPRTRLSAEMVRDQALLASGLLCQTIGGPPVMPPQPDGIWNAVYSGTSWKTAQDADRYRRAVYTYWRRTSPYPSFLMFDAPTRDLCSARRIPTNTPLQALVTLNDPVYIECADAFANRAVGIDATPETAMRWMFQAATQQEPSDLELRELRSLYDDLRSTATPDDQTDVAALVIVANTILNLDKAMTK